MDSSHGVLELANRSPRTDCTASEVGCAEYESTELYHPPARTTHTSPTTCAPKHRESIDANAHAFLAATQSPFLIENPAYDITPPALVNEVPFKDAQPGPDGEPDEPTYGDIHDLPTLSELQSPEANNPSYKEAGMPQVSCNYEAHH